MKFFSNTMSNLHYSAKNSKHSVPTVFWEVSPLTTSQRIQTSPNMPWMFHVFYSCDRRLVNPSCDICCWEARSTMVNRQNILSSRLSRKCITFFLNNVFFFNESWKYSMGSPEIQKYLPQQWRFGAIAAKRIISVRGHRYKFFWMTE